MPVLAIVSETTQEGAVLFEAADQAEERGTGVHVVYLVGLGWVSRLEWRMLDALSIGPGIDRVDQMAERKARLVAEPFLEEFTPVGLTGKPVAAIVDYANRVDASCAVVDANSRMVAGIASLVRDPIDRLADSGVEVVPVY